jgi:hypothetical protein
VHLERLGNLRRLELTGTAVTAEGIARLKQALPNCQIVYPRADCPPAPKSAELYSKKLEFTLQRAPWGSRFSV